MTTLASVFGNYISVACTGAQADRQVAGFAGSRGVTSMHMGTRGRVVTVSGSIYAQGATYALARAAMNLAISSIEAWYLPGVSPADFSFGNDYFYNCVFMGRLELAKDGRGKQYHWTASGMRCDFVATLLEQSA